MKNPYKVLNVSSNATEAEIKTAFRNLAKQTHPDANGGDSQSMDRFREVAEAYALLSDPIKRQDYDFSQATNKAETSSATNTNYQYQNDIHDTATYIELLIHQLYEAIKPIKRQASKAIAVGLAWFFGGIFVTYLSYSGAQQTGGTYYVMYGAIIFGGIQAIRALIAYNQIDKQYKDLEQEIWDKFG